MLWRNQAISYVVDFGRYFGNTKHGWCGRHSRSIPASFSRAFVTLQKQQSYKPHFLGSLRAGFPDGSWILLITRVWRGTHAPAGKHCQEGDHFSLGDFLVLPASWPQQRQQLPELGGEVAASLWARIFVMEKAAVPLEAQVCHTALEVIPHSPAQIRLWAVPAILHTRLYPVINLLYWSQNVCCAL